MPLPQPGMFTGGRCQQINFNRLFPNLPATYFLVIRKQTPKKMVKVMSYKSSCIFTVLWLIITLHSIQLFAQPSRLGRTVITRETLQAYNLLRLSDLFLLFDDWHVSTVDGFDWMVSPAALSTFQRQNWTILIDEEKYELGAFDVKNINLLPVAPQMIDSVEVYTIPQLNYGEFGERGLIDIHTRKPARRLVAQARSSAGNETGDPGPLIFTDPAVKNVDRIGPDNSLGFAFSGQRWQLQLNWQDQSHYATDPRIEFRNPRATNRELRTELLAPSLRLALKTAWGAHQFSFNHTSSANLLSYQAGGAGPVFFKPLSREVYTNQSFTHAGLHGEMPLSAKQELIYRFRYTNVVMEKHPNSLNNVDFDWNMDRFYGNVENHYQSDRYSGRVGVGWERITAHTQYPLTLGSITNNKIYGSFRYSPSKGVSQTLAFQAVSNASSRAYKTSVLTEWKSSAANNYGVGITWSERLVEEDNSIWYWSEQGYGFLADLGIDYYFPTKFHQSKMFTLDILWEHRFSKQNKLCFSTFFRRFKNLYLEEQLFQYNPDDGDFSSPAILHTDKGGQVVGLKLKYEQQLSASLRQTILYYLQDDIAGEPIFRQVWNAIPVHKIKYTISFQPTPRFSVLGVLQYLSSTVWEEYLDPGLARETPYSGRIPESWVSDISLQKWFWGDRIRTGLLFRNVLGEKLIYHPMGARFDFQIYGTLEIRLGWLHK